LLDNGGCGITNQTQNSNAQLGPCCERERGRGEREDHDAHRRFPFAQTLNGPGKLRLGDLLTIFEFFCIITVMPKQVDHDLQRQSLAAAALGVIAEHGLEAARLRDVAARAGVTTGAVTHYFDGKDAMLEAALDEIVRQILSDQDDVWAKPPRSLDDLIGSIADFLPLDPEGMQGWRIWLAFWGRAIVNERLRSKHRGYYVQISAKLQKAVRALVPGATASHARDLADAIVAAVDGIGVRATLEPELWPAKRQRAALKTLLEPMLSVTLKHRGAS
jgi:TetR/AcrR family transcriptional regulator, transcriptional repressor of bet genes